MKLAARLVWLLLLAVPTTGADKFRQLEEILPTPNGTRAASGAPAPGYWQQTADYVIHVELDDDTQRIAGRETIHYTNHSPDRLTYLWLQLDNNIFNPESTAVLSEVAPEFSEEGLSFDMLGRLALDAEFDGSIKIESVEAAGGDPLPHTVVGTMMRIDLAAPLGSGESIDLAIAWSFAIGDGTLLSTRTGYEYFENDDNYVYAIAHWFPRMVSYTDVHGWHHKQFLGAGEFTLEMGNYEVHITAPADHVVTATGVLQNPDEVLTEKQRKRLRKAETADEPIFIITPDEAKANESSRDKRKKTHVYKAERVRDFAFASSRKFIWDAQLHDQNGNHVWAMSFYPNESEPLWSQYSTHAVIHTLEVYSHYTFDYPYPSAVSVSGPPPIGGMEYPMICFNGPRPQEDGTYFSTETVGDDDGFWLNTKYGLISVVIHEVGHNFFPMIVNSDERQWTWMDEGLNSFLEYLAEKQWEEDYPSSWIEPANIVDYMKSDEQVPIMTNSDSILQFGNNAYAKPTAALNILRESILGRELFDFAFKEYARRWKFKRPMPADFFRTMEDASGVDLDWFWRGWFYTTDHTDIAVTGVRRYELDSGDPDTEKAKQRAHDAEDNPDSLTEARNKVIEKRIARFPSLRDFYNDYDKYEVTEQDRQAYNKYVEDLESRETALLAADPLIYVFEFENIGGLVMPIILELEYDNGKTEEIRIPAEIWRRNDERVSKMLFAPAEIVRLTVDPHREMADVDLSNNSWPARPEVSRFKLFKQSRENNPMQDAAKSKGEQ
jgi:aminopeptidase N